MNGNGVIRTFCAAIAAASVLLSLPGEAAPARTPGAKPMSAVVGVRAPAAKAAGVCTLPAPSLAVSPQPVSIPATLRETISAQVPFAIQNTGTGNLVVSTISVTNPPCDCPQIFAVFDSNTCVGATIPPGGSCTAYATFYAYGGTGQTWGGTIDIASNDPLAPLTSWPIEGTIGASQLTVSSAALDFGATPVVPPTPVQLPLGVSNAGTVPITVSGVSLFGAQSSAYSVVPSANCAAYGAFFPLTLPVGASCDLTFTFAPTGIGVYANVSAYVNFSDGSSFDSEFVALSGAGLGSGGSLAFDPVSINFFDVPVGQTSFTQTITVTNVDSATLALSGFAVTPPSPYVADFSDCVAAATLPPGGTCLVSLHVDAAGAAAGSYPASLQITGGATTSVLPATVAVVPNLAFNPSIHDFGDVLVGSPTTFTFVLENLDPAAYSISLAPLSSAFTMTGGTCQGGTVPASPGASVPGTCTVDVQFNPAAPGFASDFFFALESTTGYSAYANLSGNGVTPGARLQLSPGTVTFPPGIMGSPAQIAVAATNVGDSPTPTGLAFVSDNAEVTVDPGTCAVQVGAGASCTFTVHYSRASVWPGPSSLAFLTVQGTEAVPTPYANASVFGTTVASTPAAIEATPAGTATFAPTLVGTAGTPLEISLGNTGGGTSTLDIASIVSSSPEFAVTTDCPIAAPLSAQACCLAAVTFQPTAAGTRNATLTVTTTAGTLVINLTGDGLLPAPPDVAKLFTPPSVSVGQASTLTISLSNMNAFPLTNASLLDSFPAGLEVAATPAVTNSCGGSVSAVAAGTSVALANATIPASGVCSVSVSVVGTLAGAPTNTIPAGGVTTAETAAAGVSTAAASATLVVGGPLPLPTAITFTPGTVAPGVASTFDLNVSNPNPANFVNTNFTYNLPPGLVIANPANAAVVGASCGGTMSAASPGAASFTVTGLTVPTAGACDVRVDVVGAASGSYPATIAAGAIMGTVLSAPVGNDVPAISPVTLTVSVAPAPVLSVVPAPPGPVDFGSVTVASPSAPQTVTVSNTGSAPLTFSGPFTATGDFATSATTCGTTLAVAPDPASSCTATLVFTPTAVGTRNGAFGIASNGGNANLNLTGIGTPQPVPAISVAPASLAFASQTVATTSAPQALTVSSVGSAPLVVSGITVTGDFAVSSACTSLSPLSPSSTCGIDVTFTPVIPGSRVGQVIIASSDPAAPGSVVSLGGTGVAAASPNVTLAPSTLSFPTTAAGQVSAPLSSTLTNSGAAPLAILSVDLIGSGFSLTNNCGASVAVGASCTLTAVFAPTGSGSFAADVRVVTNSPAGPAFLRLGGSATAAPVGRLSATPSSIAFADQVVGTTSGAQAFTVTNTGAAVTSISGISATGDFAVEGSCFDVRPGESCAFRATFTPTALGSRAGQVVFTGDAANSPFAVNLSGTGVPLPAPRVQLSASSLGFGNALVGTATVQAVTVTNVGGADLVFGPMEARGDFRIAHGCTGTMAPGQSCRIDVGFVPVIPGVRLGEVRFTTNAGGSPHRVDLAGTGCRFSLTGRSLALVCGP